MVSKYALAYPEIRFHLQHESRLSVQTSGNGDRWEVISNIYGVEIAKQMIEVFSDGDGLKVTGDISRTSFTRSNRREIQFLENGRPIQDFALSTELIQAYHTMLMVGRYPMAILFLEMASDMVDVNVHPANRKLDQRSK